LTWRTNNNLKMQFQANGMDQLTNVSRTGTMTVSGAMDQPSGGATISVLGTGLPTTADVYSDGAWASQNAATLADGQNTYTATITDNGQTTYQTGSAYMPANMNLAYDGNGNLTNDGLRSFEYDFENQLTNVYVSSGWRSEFRYDGLGRRRVRREYTWSGGAWSLTNEVRYVYDGRVVLQERDSSNNPQVTYTRGLDLSGSFQDAGGIGGLLARSDSSGHAFYQSDASGNVVLMVKYVSGAYQTVAQYRYDPYGNLLAMNGSLAAANLYRFSSKEVHPDSGLVYYLYRYYEPNLQRWLNQDPLGDIAGLPMMTVGIAQWSESYNGGGMTDGEFQGAMVRVSLSLYTAIANTPLRMIDAFGLDPYQSFPDPDSAGKDAACYIKKHPLIIKGEHFEQAAAMFEDKDRKCYYNIPQHGKSVFPGISDADFSSQSKKDPKDKLVGHIHDHPKGERFSDKNDPPEGEPKDIELYIGKGILG
jgi:RHS repeat-associated protein